MFIKVILCFLLLIISDKGWSIQSFNSLDRDQYHTCQGSHSYQPCLELNPDDTHGIDIVPSKNAHAPGYPMLPLEHESHTVSLNPKREDGVSRGERPLQASSCGRFLARIETKATACMATATESCCGCMFRFRDRCIDTCIDYYIDTCPEGCVHELLCPMVGFCIGIGFLTVVLALELP